MVKEEVEGMSKHFKTIHSNIELSQELQLATTKLDLLEIKRRCLQADINVGSTSYSSKKTKESIRKLVEKVDQKIAVLDGSRTFAFVGVPEPPLEGRKLQLSMQSLDKLWGSGHRIDPSIHEYTVRGAASHLVGARECKIATETSTLAALNDKEDENSRNPGQIYVEDIDGCLVDLVCDGPVYIERAQNSTIIVKCHQLRLKEVINCKVHAWTPANRFVVERCRLVEIGRFWGQDLPSVDDFSDPSERSSVNFVGHEPQLG